MSGPWHYKWRDRPPTEREMRRQHLAAVIDPFARRLPGSAMGAPHDAGLVVASRNMTAATPAGTVRGVIMHTDRDSEYCPRNSERACRKLGVVRSMGKVGSRFDNAVTEACNSVLEVEYGTSR